LKIRFALLVFLPFLFSPPIARAQDPEYSGTDTARQQNQPDNSSQQPGAQTNSPSQGTQRPPDCLVHPEAQACQQQTAPGPRTQNPSEEPVPPNPSEGRDGEKERSNNRGVYPPEPPPAPTEFQLMVADSVGKMLPIYGASLFQQKTNAFAPMQNIPVPTDYVVGPGDELFVRLWGAINVELRQTVDRNGQVFIPKVGSITVVGVRVSNLDAYFRAQIEHIYKNFEVSVTLGKLRSIDIFFVGQVRRPGSYTISSLSTLVDAIFAAGGPAPQGSMRRIQLKRNGQMVTEFDLYDLLLKGDKSKDAPLLPGDVIYVPSVAAQVAVSGSVNAPAVYELKDGPVSLAAVIDLAGGLNTVADGSKATVERIDQRQARSVTEFPLDASGEQQLLKDGDIVRILSIVPRFENAVTLRGNVANPGRYPWRHGMRIRDLIPDKEALLTRNYWQSQNALVAGAMTQYRRYAKEDKSERSEPADNPRVTKDAQTAESYGPQQKSLESRADETRLRTDIKLNAPEINWDYAVIQRLNPGDLTMTLLPFSLGKAILDGNESNNLELQAGDIVTVFSQHDISVPVKRQTMFVRVEGEVRVPGIYRIQEGDTLRDVLVRAGGFTENAYIYGMQFSRESTRLEQQASLNRIASEMEAEINQKTIANTRSSPENAAAIAAQADSQRSLLQQMRQAKATGRIVLQLKPDDNGLNSIPPMALEDLDHVYVPPRSEVVSVVGSVFNQSSFLYRQGARVGDYIRAAGNGNATADLKHTLLVRADGSVVGRASVFGRFGESFDSIRILPGDAIVIPAKLQSGGFAKALRDWMLVVSQASVAAAVIAVH
jgi:polysaccharide biosynthesis/export protein